MRSFIAILCVLFVVTAVSASKREFSGWNVIGQDLPIGSDHGVPTTPWYQVSDWEVRVCSHYGGNDPAAFTQNNVQGEYYHNLMMTLQAEVTNALPGDAPVSLKSRIYEVAYFVQPTQDDESINYEVTMHAQDGSVKSIASGSSNYVNGYRDYIIEQSEVNYTYADMRAYNEHRDETLKVEFVEQKT